MRRFFVALLLSCGLLYPCLLFLALFGPDRLDDVTKPVIALLIAVFSYWMAYRYK